MNCGNMFGAFHPLLDSPPMVISGATNQESPNPEEAMNQYIHELGLFRYHLPIDGASLYKAVSQYIYGTQVKFQEILNDCVNFVEKHEEDILYSLTQHRFQRLPAYKTGDKMSQEEIHIHALSYLHEIDFLVYHRINYPSLQVSNNGFEKHITLVWSADQHFDLLIDRKYISGLALGQSIVYNILYKDVFNFGDEEVDKAVDKMLRDRDHFKHRNLTFDAWCHSVENGEDPVVQELPKERPKQVELAVQQGIPPFRFKIAKCLDPNVFRNVDYLNWCEDPHQLYTSSGQLIFEVGSKCTVRLGGKAYGAYVKSIDYTTGFSRVYIYNFQEVLTIPISQLEYRPHSKMSKEPSLIPTVTHSSPNLSLDSAISRNICASKCKVVALSKQTSQSKLQKPVKPKPRPLDVTEQWKHECPYKHRGDGKKTACGATMQVPVISQDLRCPSPPISAQPKPVSDKITSQTLPAASTGITAMSQPAKTAPALDEDFAPPSLLEASCLQCSSSCSLPQSSPHVYQGNLSLKADGSDLPMEEPHVLRYFFNLGLDVFHSRLRKSPGAADMRLSEGAPLNGATSFNNPFYKI